MAKPVSQTSSLSGYDFDENSINSKISRGRPPLPSTEDNGYPIPKTKNVKQIVNRFDKAETPSPIKSNAIKNQYIGDDDDGGEGLVF